MRVYFGQTLTVEFEVIDDETDEPLVPPITADMCEISVLRPDGTRLALTVTLTTDGTDGKFRGTIPAGSLSMADEVWTAQGRVTTSPGNVFPADDLRFVPLKTVWSVSA